LRFFLDHREAVAAFIIGNFVHDVMDQKHAAAGSFEKVFWIERVGDLGEFETVALILDGKADLFC
jgi:hypothetical protein